MNEWVLVCVCFDASGALWLMNFALRKLHDCSYSLVSYLSVLSICKYDGMYNFVCIINVSYVIITAIEKLLQLNYFHLLITRDLCKYTYILHFSFNCTAYHWTYTQ